MHIPWYEVFADLQIAAIKNFIEIFHFCKFSLLWYRYASWNEIPSERFGFWRELARIIWSNQLFGYAENEVYIQSLYFEVNILNGNWISYDYFIATDCRHYRLTFLKFKADLLVCHWYFHFFVGMPKRFFTASLSIHFLPMFFASLWPKFTSEIFELIPATERIRMGGVRLQKWSLVSIKFASHPFSSSLTTAI